MKHSVTAGRDKRYVATAFLKDPTNLKRCFVSVYNRPAAILQPQPIQDCPPSLWIPSDLHQKQLLIC